MVCFYHFMKVLPSFVFDEDVVSCPFVYFMTSQWKENYISGFPSGSDRLENQIVVIPKEFVSKDSDTFIKVLSSSTPLDLLCRDINHMLRYVLDSDYDQES